MVANALNQYNERRIEMRFKNISPKAMAYRQKQAGLFNKACAKPAAPKVEYLLEYKGRKVIVTDHVRNRAQERHGLAVEHMSTYFKHMIDGLAETEFVPVELNQEVFIYVRAFQRGCIVAFRHDYKSNSKDIVLVAVTMYPIGKNKPMKPDTEVIYV